MHCSSRRFNAAASGVPHTPPAQAGRSWLRQHQVFFNTRNPGQVQWICNSYQLSRTHIHRNFKSKTALESLVCQCTFDCEACRKTVPRHDASFGSGALRHVPMRLIIRAPVTRGPDPRVHLSSQHDGSPGRAGSSPTMTPESGST
jgi:hypothetical protein